MAGALALPGCAPGADSGTSSSAGSPSPPAATAGVGGTAAPSRAPGPSPDTPCGRLVSAIGFAELRLRPRGEEDRQPFDSATRSRIAYVEGVIVQHGAKLPPGVRGDAEALRPTIQKLARADERRTVRVAALKRFRARAADLVRACGGRPPD